MAYEDSGAEARIDALYALALSEFTPARNHLAQTLRQAGERELGDQVKRLRRPSVAAWTLNQLRRRHPEQIDELLDAGLRLRQAQERLLGQGERGLLREAAAHERELVQETVRSAEDVLRETGQAVSASLHNKLWETSHAAALDPALGETLRHGRLIEDRQLSDLGLIGGMGLDAAASPGSPRSPGSLGSPGAPPQAEPARAKPAPKTRRRSGQATKRAEKAQASLQSALRAADEADSELGHARAALQNAEAAAAQAQTVAKRAHAAVEQAREQLQRAADRVEALEQKS